MNTSKGFTLAEVLVALGVLAIGMAMVAAIFPAAMEYNRISKNSTLGTIICENAIASARSLLTVEDVTTSTFAVFADDLHIRSESNPHFLTKEEQTYPVGANNSRTGFVLLARCADSNMNIFQIFTVAYRKAEKNNTVQCVEINCTIVDDTVQTSSGNLRIGTPLINKITGRYAFVESINTDGKNGKIKNNNQKLVSGDYYVVMERKPDGSSILIKDMRRSPAMASITTIMGLKTVLQDNETVRD